MAKLHRVSDQDVIVGYSFYCPGCEEYHWFQTAPLPDRPSHWTFDGNMEEPTFTPSLVVNLHSFIKKLCHLFVRKGKIEFLSDCGHELAGQTVDLPDDD